MRFPLRFASDVDLSQAFVSGSTRVLLDLVLQSTTDVFLVMSHEQDAALAHLAVTNRNLEPVIEQLRADCICVLATDNKGPTHLSLLSVPLDDQDVQENGLIATCLVAPETIAKKRSYFNALNRCETPESAFERIFSGHLTDASKVDLVDPYAFNWCFKSTRVTHKIFQKYLLKNNRRVEIFTQLPQYWSVDYRLGDAKYGSHKDRETFKSRLEYHAQELLQEEGFEGELVINVFDYNDLPHDRHMQITFPDGEKRFGKADFFSLGNGFETFLGSQDDPSSVRSNAQVYPSDSDRMWGWLTNAGNDAIPWRYRVYVDFSREKSEVTYMRPESKRTAF